ncbi:hypothetical protein FOZ60_008649 [Perkinsus olseni]|uniref:Uncharacterized protein n=1 Tax=Perkinsus olseni TaxID=32597 RepID=A0A7J6NIT3_PEROL|nr:hypothetical protein FOZ60_008649 [Perkinsus olseni]
MPSEMPPSPPTATPDGGAFRVNIECRERYAERAQSAKEFIVDPRSRPCHLVLAARRYFCLDGSRTAGYFPKGDWRLTWLEGPMEGMDVPKRRNSVSASGVRDGDKLILRFVKKNTSPMVQPSSTESGQVPVTSSASGCSQEPDTKKKRTAAEWTPRSSQAGQSQASTGASADGSVGMPPPVDREVVKTEVKSEGQTGHEGEQEVLSRPRVSPVEPNMIPVKEQHGARCSLAELLLDIGWIDGQDQPHASSGGCDGSLGLRWKNGYRILGDMQLLNDNVDGAIEALNKLIELDGLAGVRSRLCSIVAHCGGAVSTRPFERLCTLLSEATENGVPIGRPFEGSLKSLAKDLDDLDECRSPRSFNEFRERMRVLLSVPPNCPPSFVEYSVECSRRCRRLVDNFCEVLEPLLQ